MLDLVTIRFQAWRPTNIGSNNPSLTAGTATRGIGGATAGGIEVASYSSPASAFFEKYARVPRRTREKEIQWIGSISIKSIDAGMALNHEKVSRTLIQADRICDWWVYCPK